MMEIYNFKRSTDGKNVELRINDGYIEWKYTSDDTWTQLISLDDIGTKNYEDLDNKPSINNVQLEGQLSLADLHLIETWQGTEEEFENIKASLPSGTLCYITDDSD